MWAAVVVTAGRDGKRIPRLPSSVHLLGSDWWFSRGRKDKRISLFQFSYPRGCGDLCPRGPAGHARCVRVCEIYVYTDGGASAGPPSQTSDPKTIFSKTEGDQIIGGRRQRRAEPPRASRGPSQGRGGF